MLVSSTFLATIHASRVVPLLEWKSDYGCEHLRNSQKDGPLLRQALHLQTRSLQIAITAPFRERKNGFTSASFMHFS